jgi:membrane protein implicated in regulation of membrane protease activity
LVFAGIVTAGESLALGCFAVFVEHVALLLGATLWLAGMVFDVAALEVVIHGNRFAHAWYRRCCFGWSVEQGTDDAAASGYKEHKR